MVVTSSGDTTNRLISSNHSRIQAFPFARASPLLQGFCTKNDQTSCFPAILSGGNPLGNSPRSSHDERRPIIDQYPGMNLTKTSKRFCRFLCREIRLLPLWCVLGILEWLISLASAATTDQFFDREVVQEVHLEVKLDDLDRLHRALPTRICVPGVFRWDNQVIQPVGVRYKGNSSSGPDANHKRSFLIAFSEFNKGQRFLGLRHVALDNGIQFGSLFSERLITDALRQLSASA